MGGNLDQTMLLRLWHCLVITGDTRWADCDHLMWHWPFLTWLVACLPPRPRSVFIRQISQTPGGELCRFSLLCNRSRLSTMTHVKEVENEDLIHSATSLSLLALPCLASLFLPEINLLLNLSFHWGAVGACHMKERAMDLGTRQQFDNVILISWNWKMTLGGRLGQGTELPCQSVKHTNLI